MRTFIIAAVISMTAAPAFAGAFNVAGASVSANANGSVISRPSHDNPISVPSRQPPSRPSLPSKPAGR